MFDLGAEVKKETAEYLAKIELFRGMCKAHDLTYAYSDDSRVYRRGRDQYAEIKEAAKKLPPDVAARIWNEAVREKLLPGGESDFLWKEGP